jgi:DNA recombination protein RmuC
MSAFEVVALAGLVVLIGMNVAILVAVLRSSTTQLDSKMEAIDTRLSDNIGIVTLAVSGLREEVNNSSSALRTEVAARVDALGTNLQTTLGNIGTQQGEKLDGLAAGQTRRFDSFATALTDHRTATGNDSKALRDEVQSSLLALGRKVAENLDATGNKQAESLANVTTTIREMSEANVKKQDALKAAVEGRLEAIREENARKLEEMRVTVDEKLQGTLEKRLGASFSQVNENLERVYKSVGEMQALATGVGDLKRVLSNVKLRGSWGEGALGAILDDLLAPEQFSKNVEVNPGSGQRVEFALRQPGAKESVVWVPIDSKMPNEDYERMILASEQGDSAAVEQCAKALERCVLKHATDISTKYICHPHTTEFAVLFLPTEGLFAEVVRRPGLIDKIRSQFRVEVAGPTTLTAYLHVLRSAFKAMAIQERSSEVWQVLGAVKTEFGKFGDVLEKVHRKLGEAQNVVEDAHRRRRAVDRKLRDVEALPDATAQDVLALASVTPEEIIDDELPTADAAE